MWCDLQAALNLPRASVVKSDDIISSCQSLDVMVWLASHAAIIAIYPDDAGIRQRVAKVEGV